MELFNQLTDQRRPITPLSIDDFAEGADGIARLPDWRLAEVLDYSYGPKIRQLIERHRTTLEQFGDLYHRGINYPGPGRPGSEYLLNFNQQIFVIIKSEAPNAIPVQIHVVKIYGLWATGQLRPVDQATAVIVAEATTQAYQQSPELMGMLQSLLDQIGGVATRSDTGEISQRVASLQRTALETQERLNGIVKRRPAPVSNVDIYDRVIQQFYWGNCPCCMRPDRIIIKDGQHTKLYALDHITDNPYKNALHEMWAVCRPCNGKLTHDSRYRAEMMERFRVFLSHVQTVLGEKLL